MVDLIALAILLIASLLGAYRGTLSTGLRLGSLLLAYGVSLAATPLAGPWLAERYALPELIAALAAGGGVFIVAYVLLGLAGSVIKFLARRRRRRLGLVVGTGDRVGGALLGAVQGSILVLLLGLLVSYVDALKHAPGGSSLPGVPGAESSKLIATSRSLARRGAEAAFAGAGAGGRIAVEIVSNPGETVQRFQQIMKSPRIEALQSDRLFWSYVENGALDQALNRASFLGIAQDSRMRAALADLGVVSEEARQDPRLFRSSVKDALEQVGPRVRRIKDDPAFLELARDPEVAAALESGNTLALFSHPEFRSLISRALDAGPAPASGQEGEAGQPGR